MKNHEHLTPALSPLGRGEGEIHQPILKVTLSPGEFEMVRWAQRVCARSRQARRAVGIAAFARGALLDAVGQAISEVQARPGGFVPPEVARTWEETKGKV